MLEADGLERPIEQRILPAGRHDLDGHAALEELLLLKAVRRRLFRRHERRVERAVLRLRHRAVDVGGLALPVAGGAVGLRHVDGLETHDGRGGIVEIEGVAVRAPRDVVCERSLRERAARDDGHRVLREWDFLYLRAHDMDLWMRFDPLRDVVAEAVTIHGECAARGHARGVRRRHDERAETAHLLLEHADGVLQSRAAQGVAADELGEAARLVRGCLLLRAHLIERDLRAAQRSLPRCLGASEPRADDRDVFHDFFSFFSSFSAAALAAAFSSSFACLAARRARIFSSSSLMGLPTRDLQSSLLQ